MPVTRGHDSRVVIIPTGKFKGIIQWYVVVWHYKVGPGLFDKDAIGKKAEKGL